MKQPLALPAFVLFTLASAPALGCPPAAETHVIVPVVALFLAVPFFLAASFLLGIFLRRWRLSFWQWLRSTVASYAVAAIGAGAGMAFGLFIDGGDELVLTLALTSPLVTTVAYVMWVRSRRHTAEPAMAEAPTSEEA